MYNMKNLDKNNKLTDGAGSPSTFMTVLLVVMSSFPPLTTDMYLPALTSIAEELHTSISLANLTLVLFFVFFSLSTLLWGPVTDKYGRKPSLLVGIVMYGLASIGCALSHSIHTLIAFRILQALGAGAPVTVSIAIVQDLYKGDQKKKVLAILSALMMVAPVVAPVLGSTILSFSSWKSIFLFLFMLGLVSLIGVFFIPETIRHKSNKSVLGSFSGLFIVLKDPFFRKTVVIFSMPAIIVLGFVGGSSSILMSGFGVSSNTFTAYFATNSVFSILGALLYVPISKKIGIKPIVYTSFFVMLISGGLIATFGNTHALSFMFCMFPATLAAAVLRPLGVDIMMEKSGNDAGSASAIINFLFTILGSASMEIIALEWNSRTLVFAILTLFSSVFCLLFWHLLSLKAHKGTGKVCRA